MAVASMTTTTTQKRGWAAHILPRLRLLTSHGGAQPPLDPRMPTPLSGLASAKALSPPGFVITHTPDRPARVATGEDAPSDGECLAFFERLRREERASRGLSSGTKTEMGLEDGQLDGRGWVIGQARTCGVRREGVSVVERIDSRRAAVEDEKSATQLRRENEATVSKAISSLNEEQLPGREASTRHAHMPPPWTTTTTTTTSKPQRRLRQRGQSEDLRAKFRSAEGEASTTVQRSLSVRTGSEHRKAPMLDSAPKSKYALEALTRPPDWLLRNQERFIQRKPVPPPRPPRPPEHLGILDLFQPVFYSVLKRPCNDRLRREVGVEEKMRGLKPQERQGENLSAGREQKRATLSRPTCKNCGGMAGQVKGRFCRLCGDEGRDPVAQQVEPEEQVGPRENKLKPIFEVASSGFPTSSLGHDLKQADVKGENEVEKLIDAKKPERAKGDASEGRPVGEAIEKHAPETTLEMHEKRSEISWLDLESE